MEKLRVTTKVQHLAKSSVEVFEKKKSEWMEYYVCVFESSDANVFLPSRPETFLSTSTEHSNKDKAKERDREEREKKKVKDREREKEKKKHKVVNEIKRENGEVKQPIKGWWKRTYMQTKWFMLGFF